MKNIRRLTAVLMVLITALFTTQGIAAQSAVTFSSLSASHVFGESLHFEADITAYEPISKLELIFKADVGESTVLTVMVSDGNRLSADYQIDTQNGFAPFSEISYWFLATLESGEQVQSEVGTLVYSDNRYTWQSLGYEDSYHAYWIDGDTAFGQSILDAAIYSFSDFDRYVSSLPVPETLNIYVYPSTSSLQTALEVSGAGWSAGFADPSSSQIYAAIPNSSDSALDMGNTIPHEITHVRLYLLLGDFYSNLPAWLSEGLAQISERYPSDTSALLAAAREEDALFSFQELCTSFPGDSTGAAVAYAQSESLVRYIFARYGKIGLHTLLEYYSQGYSCENGVLDGLDVSLDQLAADWYRYQFQTTQALEGESQLFGWTLIGAALFLAPMALLIFSRKPGDKEEVFRE